MEILHAKKASQLYHLKPIGIGTPNVESPISYMKRLAEAHSVSVGNFISKELLPDLNRSYLQIQHLTESKASRLISISSEIMIDILQILENKTKTQLEDLNMSRWNDCLSSKNMYRKWHAWCPICYHERSQLGQTVYEELIWNFKGVDICKKHQVKLAQTCPNCGKQVSLLGNLSRVGYCDKCLSWLGLRSYEERLILKKEKEQSNWIYDQIGQLITNKSILEGQNKFKNNITKIVRLNKISQRSLAKSINFNHEGIRNWLSGRKPNLTYIANLSYVSGYTIVELLCFDIDPINISFKNIEQHEKIKIEVNIKIIEQELKKAIKSKENLSLQKFCKINKVSYATIKYQFPVEASVLVTNHKKYKEDQKKEKHGLIRSTMILLHERGIYPGRKTIWRTIGRNLIADDKDKEVWLDTLEELGYICQSCTNE